MKLNWLVWGHSIVYPPINHHHQWREETEGEYPPVYVELWNTPILHDLKSDKHNTTHGPAKIVVISILRMLRSF